MKVIHTKIPDLFIIEPRIFGDKRGFFYESFNQRVWEEKTGLKKMFVQDNHSRSSHNVLRGLHYQVKQPQGKLIRVIIGKVYDVAVDIREDSPTFGKWEALTLSDENKLMLWIPEGFAHGFLVLSDIAEFVYKTTDYWAPEYEHTIIWNDPYLAINWPVDGQPVLSAKDKEGKTWAEAFKKKPDAGR